jgi:hypothetical protein
MAETVKIKIETQGADKLTDNLQEAVEVGKSLKAQYKEAVLEVQRLAAAYGDTSVEVREAAKRAAELKDTIEDSNDAISAFKGEGAFLAMGKAVSAVASGFAAVQGGLGLLGVESENIEATLLKVQSAMALAQGLAGLEDAGRAFKTLGTVAVDALKGIRTGIAMTGIGVLLVALGAVVAYWEDISQALGIVTDEQKKFNEAQAAQKKIADEQTASVKKESAEFVGLVSMLKATNVGSKERENLIKNINKQYGTTLKNIKDETTFQNQLNLAVENYIIQKQNEFALKANEGILTDLFQKKSDATKEFNKQLRILTDGYTLVDKEQGLYLSNSAKSDTVLDRTTGKYVSAAVTLGDLRDKNSLVNTVMLKQEQIMSNVDGRIENLSKTNLKLGASNKMVTTTTDDVIDKTKEAADAITDYTKAIVDAEINLISDESQRQQTKLISDAEFRKQDIEKSNADEKQKAALIKLIDAQLIIDLDAMDKEFNDKRLAKEKQLTVDMITEDEKYLNSLNAIRDLETSYMDEGVDKDVKMRENKYQDELVLLQKYLDDETLTRAQYDELVIDAEKKKAADIQEIKDKAAEESRKKEIDNLKKTSDEFLKAINSVIGDGSRSIGLAIGGAISGVSNFLEIINTEFAEGVEGTMQKINAYTQAISGVLNSFVDAAAQANKDRLNDELETINTATNAEKEALNKRYKDGLLTKEQFDKAFKDLDDNAKKKELAARKIAFESEKKTKIASSVINGFQGAVAAFTGAMSLGPIAGPIVGAILAASVAAMTGLNISKIKSTKFDGGDVGQVSAPSPGGGGVDMSSLNPPTPQSLSITGDAMGGSEGGGLQLFGARQGGGNQRSYVVESDISNTQKKLSTYQQRAEIG